MKYALLLLAMAASAFADVWTVYSTATTITFMWDDVSPNAPTLNYQMYGATTWMQWTGSVGQTEYTLTGLTANSVYWVNINNGATHQSNTVGNMDPTGAWELRYDPNIWTVTCPGVTYTTSTSNPAQWVMKSCDGSTCTDMCCARLGYDGQCGTAAYDMLAPEVPTGFAITGVWETQVSITWEANALGGAPESFNLATRAGSDAWVTVAAGWTDPWYHYTGLMPGTDYKFRTKAQNAAGQSDAFIVEATTDDLAPSPTLTAIPEKPAMLVCSDNDDTWLHLEWFAGIGATTDMYTVHHRETGTGPWMIDCWNTVNTNCDITGLTPSTDYDVRSRARNGAGKGGTRYAACSTSAGAIPTAAPDARPGQVQGLVATFVSATFVVLEWKAPAYPRDGGVTDSYKVWYRSNSGTGWGAWMLVDRIWPTTIIQIDGLTPETDYMFRVKARNDNGDGMANWDVQTTLASA